MQYRNVTSDAQPNDEQLLQGKKLINIDVVESTTTDDEGTETTTYSYVQLVVDTSSDTDEQIVKYRAEVAQDYLDSTDYIDNKYVREVLVFNTSTDEEFKAKYEDTYTKRAEATLTIRAYEDVYTVTL